MPADFNNKNILITGGTQSIGEAIAKSFIEQGANVWITGRRSQGEGDVIAAKIGASCQYIPLVVNQQADWQRTFAYFAESDSALDVLVNNAGIEYPSMSDPSLQNPENCSLSDWRDVYAVNVDGVFLGCQTAIKLMKKQGGVIVNIGSRSGLVGVPASAAYSSSKAAVTNLTKSVALHCANQGYNIRCNVIHPAAIDTHMWDKELGTDNLREQRKQAFANNIPLGRMGAASDIADAVLFFASSQSGFITGTELVVDGGIMAGSAAAASDGEIEVD